MRRGRQAKLTREKREEHHDDRIRIAFVIDCMGSILGGTEKQLLGLLRRLDRNRFEPVLLILADSSAEASVGSHCETIILDYRGFFSLKFIPDLMKFRRIVRDLKIRVVQTFFEDSILFTYIATRCFSNPPILICSRRDVGMESENRWYHTIYDLLRPYVLSGFDWIAVNSQSVKSYVMAKDRVTEPRIVNIPNGVELPTRPAPRPVLLQADRVEFRIGMVANIKPIKRIDVFVEAVKSFSLKLNRLKFQAFLIGNTDSSEGEMWKQAVRDMGLGSKVIFTGSVNNVGDYLRYLDVGVLCSDKEGSSNAVLEYMARGLPVIASDIPSNAELVRNNENGFLFPPGNSQALADAMVKLGSDKELREKMGKASKLTAERYSWEACMRNWELFYQEAVR